MLIGVYRLYGHIWNTDRSVEGAGMHGIVVLGVDMDDIGEVSIGMNGVYLEILKV